MKHSLLVLLVFLSCKSIDLKEIELINILELPAEIDECSGLSFDGAQLYTINDSGNDPIIYVLDMLNGSLKEQHLIAGSINVDWEAVEFKSDHFWIADTGNNFGNRVDTKVYRVNPDYVVEETIDIKFKDKVEVPSGTPHNYDIEAFTFCDEQLFFFTKNRANAQTDVQVLDIANSGDLVLRQSIDVLGFITDATAIPEKDLILLISQRILNNRITNFLVVLEMNDCTFTKIKELELPIFDQAEGLCYVGDDMIFIGSEDEAGSNTQKLYQLQLSF